MKTPIKVPVLIASLLATLMVTGCKLRVSDADGSGTIECTQVQVAPKVSGRIAELPPREGMMLRKGDLVARLEAVDYELRRNETRAALAHTEAQLALLQAGSRAEDVQRARDQVREARVAVEAAQNDLLRILPVFQQGSATQKQRDDAKAAADRTAAVLAQAEQNLARLVKGTRIEEIHVSEAQVELARTRLAQADKAVADCAITAPVDGTVTTRIREDGEFVGVGSPLITLSRLDEVWLSVYVPEDRLGKVKLGEPARVKIDGDPRFHAGKVTFVSPEAEFTPRNVQTPTERAKLVYRVKITLPNPEGIFKAGMPADGYFGAAK